MTTTTTGRVWRGVSSCRRAPGGFERCPRCHTMRGPVPACPSCGWSVGCKWCKLRVWIPGSGWTLSPAYANVVSHGICPWCVVRAYGGDPKVISFAAERLGVPAGLLHVSATRMKSGKYLVVSYGNRTGWAGLMKPVSALDGLN